MRSTTMEFIKENKYLTIYAEPDYLLINPYGTDDLSFSSQWSMNSMSVVTQTNKGKWNFGDERETFSLR
jgi:hypothetical protein